MSQPHVPGPCPIYVGLGGGGSPLFLGFSERGVNIDLNASFSPYVVDISGSTPLDQCYQGEGASISFDLTNWNEPVLSLMQDIAGNIPGSVRGLDVFGEVGTLMGYELAAFTCWFPFPYALKPAYALSVSGYRFPLCYIDRSSLPERGSKPAKTHLTLQALRAVNNTQSGAPIGNIQLKLYDHDMTAVAGLPIS